VLIASVLGASTCGQTLTPAPSLSILHPQNTLGFKSHPTKKTEEIGLCCWRRGRDDIVLIASVLGASTCGQTLTPAPSLSILHPQNTLGFKSHPTKKTEEIGLCCWRRGRDSNPRGSFRPPNDLANRPLQPLGYLSSSPCNALVDNLSTKQVCSTNLTTKASRLLCKFSNSLENLAVHRLIIALAGGSSTSGMRFACTELAYRSKLLHAHSCTNPPFALLTGWVRTQH
jgi:hypothetical protein